MERYKTTKKIDGMGRVIIPMELRRTLGLERNAPLEIYSDDESIIMQKYERDCVFCGKSEDVVLIFGKPVCFHCMEEIANEGN